MYETGTNTEKQTEQKTQQAHKKTSEFRLFFKNQLECSYIFSLP